MENGKKKDGELMSAGEEVKKELQEGVTKRNLGRLEHDNDWNPRVGKNKYGDEDLDADNSFNRLFGSMAAQMHRDLEHEPKYAERENTKVESDSTKKKPSIVYKNEEIWRDLK